MTVPHPSGLVPPPPVDKSVGAALALTFFFGPLGLFYTSVTAALVMIGVAVVVGIFTIGFGLLLIWPASMIWSAVDAGRRHQAFETWKVMQSRPW